MRIGIDASMIYTDRPTGLGTFSINIVNELARAHHDVVIWTVDDSALSVPKDKIRNILQLPRLFNNNLYLVRPFWTDFVLPQLLKREKIDILYSTVLLGPKRYSVPHVVTVHDLFPLTLPEDSPRPVRWNYQWRVPKILNRSAGIVAVSHYTKQEIIKNYKIASNKINVIHEGYDAKHFVPCHNSAVLERYGLNHKNYILSVAASHKRKNLQRLIQAFSLAKNNIPHRLVLIGPKNKGDFHDLELLVNRSGVPDRIVLLNYVSYADLPFLYSSADIFMYVSLYEGFGLPVLEAMACGTPVIASNTSSLPEVAGDAAILLDPLDCYAMADALTYILTDSKRSQDLSTKGTERCRHFSWRKAAEETLFLLKAKSAD
jgi:glycosyltransferase involved in cell wall biosynthesis